MVRRFRLFAHPRSNGPWESQLATPFQTIVPRRGPPPLVAVLALLLLLSPLGAAQQPVANPPSAPSDRSVQQLPSNQLPQLTREIAAVPLQPPPHRESPEQAKYDVTRIGSRGIGSGVNFYSLQREEALGRELSHEVEAESRLVKDPLVTEYINRVGQNLVRNSDARVPFTIKVLDNDEVNAFALPGGFFYVNSGLILAADNEAQLAGVMAHEIGHVAARHATRDATRSQILNLATIPLIFVGGPAGYAARQVMGLAVPMSFLKFSRDAEREADLLGLEYAYAAGYDPAEFVHFFETLQVKKQHKQSFIAKAFATHPMTSERIKRAEKEISTLLPPRPEYVVDTSEFEQVKARLAQLMHRHLGDRYGERPVLRQRTVDTTSIDAQRPTLKRVPVTSAPQPFGDEPPPSWKRPPSAQN